MKLHVLLMAVSLGVFLSRSGESAPGHTDTQLPVLTHLGEEYFIRLDNDQRSPPHTEALQLQLTQRLLGGQVGNKIMHSLEARERRSEEPPISLDLTFHLLREVLQMARAEQQAQRVSKNRKMMDFFGK
ncbi:corticoliberin-1 [Xyrauchen texanus]|uniref:corticoliberin-1 n=1 Tax=Xyrauchen texanus TaxID=154827 RepID=UPI0022428E96|nr:corticoliberin-1 [Xyrauchen texanus]